MSDPRSTDDDHKTCPACGEQVREAARMCRHCRHRFDEAGDDHRATGADAVLHASVGEAQGAARAGVLAIIALAALWCAASGYVLGTALVNDVAGLVAFVALLVASGVYVAAKRCTALAAAQAAFGVGWLAAALVPLAVVVRAIIDQVGGEEDGEEFGDALTLAISGSVYLTIAWVFLLAAGMGWFATRQFRR